MAQDWANTKAAYRFLSNDRVSEADILGGHFQSTRNRTVATDGLVLVLHDTTEFTYQREDTDAIGITKSINSRRDEAGRLRSNTVCGILMHSSLAVTTDGLPLGLAAVKFWTRKKFKGTAALPKRTRVRANLSLQLAMSERPPRIDDGRNSRSRVREVEHTKSTGHLHPDRRHGYLGTLLADTRRLLSA